MQTPPFRDHPLPHYGERPESVAIDTLIIHSIYAPGQPNVCDPEACIKLLDEHEVSSHYLIGVDGGVWHLVADEKRAWHAGISRLPWDEDPRENVNDFSLGVELVNEAGQGFTAAQYDAVTQLTVLISRRHPLRYVLGHEHIAPGRKQDPGPRFDWPWYISLLRNAGLTNLRFPS